MNAKLKSLIAIAVLALAAVAVVACGNNNDSSTTSTEASAASTTASSSSSGTADVSLAEAGDLGQVLVGPNGNTLYLFAKDTSGGASTCSGECAAGWPPLTVKGKATVGDGLDSSLLTTFKREDGQTQLAYNGHPLYFYAGDTQPGDTNGNDVDAFGAEWYAMNSSGESVADSEGSSDSDTGGTSTTGGGSGYSY